MVAFFFKLAPKPVQTGYDPSRPSGWAMCFTFKHCWLYFSLFLYQSPSVSHMLTSGSREVKTTILNQLLSRLFNWKTSDIMFHLPALNYVMIRDAKWSNDMHDYWSTPLFGSILSDCLFEKCSSRVVAFIDVTIVHLTQHLLRIERQNKYTKVIWQSLVLLLPEGEIPPCFLSFARCLRYFSSNRKN